MASQHQLHVRYTFKGRRKAYSKTGRDKLVWESRATNFWGKHLVEEIECDAEWFYSTMVGEQC